jgi:hypothetical protein
MILTHYNHKNDAPFQNLSSLAEDEALSVISTLRDRAGLVCRRFRNPKQYLKQRREAESWVRKEFDLRSYLTHSKSNSRDLAPLKPMLQICLILKIEQGQTQIFKLRQRQRLHLGLQRGRQLTDAMGKLAQNEGAGFPLFTP